MKNCFSLGKYIKYTMKERTFPSFMPKVGGLHSGNIKTHLALHLSAFFNIILTNIIGETNSTKHSSPTSKRKCVRYILFFLFFFIIIIIIIIIIKMPIKYHVLIQIFISKYLHLLKPNISQNNPQSYLSVTYDK